MPFTGYLGVALVSFAALTALVQPASAVEIPADASNYRALLRKLRPGDTLKLAPGIYPRLRIAGLRGEPHAWITITGPSSGNPAVIQAVVQPELNRSDVIDIYDSSYVAVENLRIDSRGIAGAFGIAAHGGEQSLTHHIRVEGNVFVGQNGNQQTDAISTKTPTWGWVIRRNQIIGAGTGLYLGSSDGTWPFVQGLIEENLVMNTIGYNMEIKFQKYLPEIEGMPLGHTSTIIRNNVFIKDDQASPDGDRPNVLVGGFPFTGRGSLNMYEIYGNYFSGNHREALLQASGRVSIHDNIFVDGPYAYHALVLRNHDEPLKIAYIYNNTVYTSGRGIYFGSRARIDDAVVGNIVIASPPLAGSIMRQANNLTDLPANAAKYFTSSSMEAGDRNVYPLKGTCQGPPIDLTMFHTDTDYGLDFNGTPKVRARRAVVFRGAYAGDGENAGWRLQAARKEMLGAADEPVPALVWITPATVQPGSKGRLAITGMNFSPDSKISVSGTGITVSDISVESTTKMAASFVVSPTVSAGIRDIAVMTSTRSSDPVIIRITPRAARGAPRLRSKP